MPGRNTLRYVIEAAVLAGLTLAVLVPWGCSRSPLGPDTIPTNNTFTLPNGVVAYPGSSLPLEESPDEPLAVPIILDTTGTTGEEKGTWLDSIDLEGGVIDMDVEGEKSYFFVPTSGLEEKTEIRVTMFRRPTTVDKRITEFHFEPGGLQFRAAAMLSYHTLLKDGEILQLSWWDATSGKWVLSAEAVVVGGYATFPVYHFSDYRTTERVSLGGQRAAQ